MSRPKKTLPIKQLHQTILGYAYIFWWSLRAKVRAFLARWAVGLLTAFLFYAVIEVVLELFGHGIGPNSSIVLQISFFTLIGISLYGKLREWTEHRQQFYFIQAAKEVVQLMSATPEALAQEAVIGQLLAIFAKTFERRKTGIPNASVTLSRPNNGLGLNYWYPESAHYDSNFELAEGEGGAGYCCENRCVVYIPRVSLGHAIVQNIDEDQPYRVVADLFVSRGQDAFQSVLSVPLVAYGTCFGALNFDSKTPNAFQRLDFEQALFYGLVVAQVLHLRSQGSRSVT